MGLKTVIVLVKTGQAKERAWRSHLSKNPADRDADIKIFHFDPQKEPRPHQVPIKDHTGSD